MTRSAAPRSAPARAAAYRPAAPVRGGTLYGPDTGPRPDRRPEPRPELPAATAPRRGGDFGYHPALDGMRALAVTAVLLFHGGVGFLPGGFLGVDAFFVLSGFLITSLLLTEYRRAGRIRLGGFWARRARRLLPALLATLVATAVAGRYLLSPFEVGLLRTDALAALGYVANWRMIYRGSDYFTQNTTPSLLQHTWSLGIEEQFYLLWPLIVVAVLAGVAVRGRSGTGGAQRLATRLALLTGLSVAGTAASMLAAAWLYRPGDVNRAYFGTDSRAQALLIGCALAATMIAVPARPARGTGGHRVLGLLALAGAAGTGYLWARASGTDGWLYQGGLTLGALAVAAVLAHAVASPRSPTARLLALPPLVWLGRVSYGLYLYHWPLFQLVNGERTGLSGAPLLALRLAATLAVATASFYGLERPVQRLRWSRLPRLVPVAAVAGGMALTLAAVLAATLAVPAGGGADSVQAAADLGAPTPGPAGSAHPGTAVPVQRAGRTPGALPRVDFFGDSVAWSLGSYLPPHPTMSVQVRAIQGCGIALLPDILQLGTPHTNYPYCPQWPDRWKSGVDTDDPDVSVILLDRWELMDRKLNGVYRHVGQPDYDAYLTGQLDQAVRIAGARGAAVVLLTAPYTHRAETPSGGLYPEDQPARVDAWNVLVRKQAAAHPGTVTVLDLNLRVCPGGRYTATINGLQVRSDGLHFTPDGVKQWIAPWLLPQLTSLATTGTP